MKQTFTLLLFLALLSYTALAQKTVLLHSFDQASSNLEVALAEDRLFINKASSFEVYQLPDGQTYSVPKVYSPHLTLNRTWSSFGQEVIFNPEFDGTYISKNTQSNVLLQNRAMYSICTGKNYTVAVVGEIDTLIQVVAIDRATQQVTTLLERKARAYGARLGYLASEDLVYITVQMEPNRVEVYSTDGTKSGTRFMGDVKPLDYNHNTSGYLLDNGKELYLVSVDNDKADKTPVATQLFKLSNSRLTPLNPISNLGFKEGQTYGKGDTFYSYDPASGYLVKTQDNKYANILALQDFGSFRGEFGANLIFLANRSAIALGDTTYSLFETNGTPTGTKLIAKNVDGFLSTGSVKAYKGNLYFFKFDTQHGHELWRYDGTKAYIVEDIIPGAAGLINPYFFIYKDELYFTAQPTGTDGQVNLYKLADDASGIKLSTYIDYNSNQVKDPEEPYLTQVKYKFKELDRIIHTSENINNITLEHGTHTVTLLMKDGWFAPLKEQQVIITLPEDNGKSYSFGLTPEQLNTRVNATLMSDATRCGFPTPYTLHYSNSGTTVASGTIKLIPEKKFRFDSASLAPHAVSGDTLVWQLNELEIGKKGKILLNFTMPGVEHMGDTLVSRLLTNFHTSANSTTHADTTTLQQILTCSYDPNDIQVNPAGEGEKHLTLKKKKLEYLIRFQNMGTDKAFNIVVTNELQPELDLSTFEVIGSSHDMYTVLEGNQVSFHFDNIHLPDDKTDEPGSHGYILYTIKPKTGLRDSTVIQNQAFIYFDYNPAIETNIVFNTLVDRLPAKAVLAVEDEFGEFQPTVFPNPAEDQLNIAWPSGGSTYTLYSLLNSQGKVVLQAEHKTGTVHQLHVAKLPAGLYFLRATRQGGTLVRKVVIQ